MQQWLATNPTVPDEHWFKRFGNFTLCGTGTTIRTFLTRQQVAIGIEIPEPARPQSRQVTRPDPEIGMGM
jgi:hypothetical protein